MERPTNINKESVLLFHKGLTRSQSQKKEEKINQLHFFSCSQTLYNMTDQLFQLADEKKRMQNLLQRNKIFKTWYSRALVKLARRKFENLTTNQIDLLGDNTYFKVDSRDKKVRVN